MVIVKLRNVSVYNGNKFRPNQNYTISLNRTDHAVSEITNENDVKNIIEKYFHKIIMLNKRSIIKIVGNTFKDAFLDNQLKENKAHRKLLFEKNGYG